MNKLFIIILACFAIFTMRDTIHFISYVNSFYYFSSILAIGLLTGFLSKVWIKYKFYTELEERLQKIDSLFAQDLFSLTDIQRGILLAIILLNATGLIVELVALSAYGVSLLTISIEPEKLQTYSQIKGCYSGFCWGLIIASFSNFKELFLMREDL